MGNSNATSLKKSDLSDSLTTSMTNKPEIPSILAKPLDDKDVIFRILSGHVDIWQNILNFLTTKELLCFMLTCKIGQEYVLEYIKHFVNTNNRLNATHNLLGPNSNFPLLLQEKALKLKLSKLNERFDPQPTLVHLKAVMRFCNKQKLIRTHVYEADDFPHLGNPNYIVRKFDETLNRDIVQLRSVCWLFFVINFPNISPGTYEFSLRMKLEKDFRWPNWNEDQEYFTTIAAKIIEDDPRLGDIELVKDEVHGSTWEKIQKRDKTAQDMLRNSSVVYDNFGTGSDFFWYNLKSFEVTKPCTLKFVFCDKENPYWKSGMIWDFVQLKRI